MKLSAKERRRIYEEEKARIAARKRLEREKAKTVSTLDLEPNASGLLCYVGWWISGVVLLLLEQKNRFVRFHAIQSIITFGILWLVGGMLYMIPFIGPFFGTVVGIIGLILWIVLMIKAYHYKLFKVPLVGDWSERLSRVSPKDIRAGERAKAKPPKPQQPPPPSRADEFKRRRWARITASIFAIAWSIVLLVFFNFYNQYIAYYHLDRVTDSWVRYQVLTTDFNTWLPLLTILLTVSIVGHFILIIFDKYILREIIKILLNLGSIAVVAALLAIAPYDFSSVPSADSAQALPVIVTASLITIAVCLAIAVLVDSIKLIVRVAARSDSY